VPVDGERSHRVRGRIVRIPDAESSRQATVIVRQDGHGGVGRQRDASREIGCALKGIRSKRARVAGSVGHGRQQRVAAIAHPRPLLGLRVLRWLEHHRRVGGTAGRIDGDHLPGLQVHDRPEIVRAAREFPELSGVARRQRVDDKRVILADAQREGRVVRAD
jgi:hypothetical protein